MFTDTELQARALMYRDWGRLGNNSEALDDRFTETVVQVNIEGRGTGNGSKAYNLKAEATFTVCVKVKVKAKAKVARADTGCAQIICKGNDKGPGQG